MCIRVVPNFLFYYCIFILFIIIVCFVFCFVNSLSVFFFGVKVTRYEKTDHSQLNMILQDGDLYSEEFFFFPFFFFSFCETITFSLSIHKISLQYNVVCLP